MIPVVLTDNGIFASGLRRCRWGRQQVQQDRIDRMFSFAHIPAAYADAEWSDYRMTDDNRPAVDAAHWVIAEPKKGLYIYGSRGSGKTMLAAIIAREKAKAGQAVLFESVPDLLMDIRESFRTDKTAEIVETARTVPCLVLDDMGAERMSEWVGEELFTLINYRYNNKLQTIITSNCTISELQEKMVTVSRDGAVDNLQGQRIGSRIFGMCKPVRLNGYDWRKVKE